MIRTLFIACILQLLSYENSKAGQSEVVPTKLIAFAGNTWVGSYHIELDGGTLLFWHGGPQDRTNAERITPSLEDWRKFRKELDSNGIWQWQSEYSTRAIYDSTGWIFEIRYADRRVKTEGDGGVFPDKDGAPIRAFTQGAEAQYARYVNALRKLIGRDEFPF